MDNIGRTNIGRTHMFPAGNVLILRVTTCS